MNLKNYLRLLPDWLYLYLDYYHKMGKRLHLLKPKRYTEKLQWLKLHDRNEKYTVMVDKFAAKQYVASIIGEEYIIPSLGVWNCFNDINVEHLPNSFVLKCTHDSGGLVICEDKRVFDVEKARTIISDSLCDNYYYSGREWPYKHVKPRIIAEQYMGDNLNDYKFFCFNGLPKICLVCSDRKPGEKVKEDFYDMDWNHLDMRRPGHENSFMTQKRPSTFDEMVSISKELSKDIPFVRVDLYEIDGHCYFGEMTFFPAAGFEGFEPAEWDMKLGNMLVLPKEM